MDIVGLSMDVEDNTGSRRCIIVVPYEIHVHQNRTFVYKAYDLRIPPTTDLTHDGSNPRNRVVDSCFGPRYGEVGDD